MEGLGGTLQSSACRWGVGEHTGIAWSRTQRLKAWEEKRFGGGVSKFKRAQLPHVLEAITKLLLALLAGTWFKYTPVLSPLVLYGSGWYTDAFYFCFQSTF